MVASISCQKLEKLWFALEAEKHDRGRFPSFSTLHPSIPQQISKNDTQYTCLTPLDTQFAGLSKTDTRDMNSFNTGDSPQFISSTPSEKTIMPPFFFL
jgi:hypothetical protein